MAYLSGINEVGIDSLRIRIGLHLSFRLTVIESFVEVWMSWQTEIAKIRTKKKIFLFII